MSTNPHKKNSNISMNMIGNCRKLTDNCFMHFLSKFNFKLPYDVQQFLNNTQGN